MTNKQFLILAVLIIAAPYIPLWAVISASVFAAVCGFLYLVGLAIEKAWRR